MNNDEESKWLRDRMALLRRRRGASVVKFDQIWQAAQRERRARQMDREWPWWKLASASLAAFIIVAAFVLQTQSRIEDSRHKEQEFATVDGILMTNWQAPSDDLIRLPEEDLVEQR